MTEGGRMSVNLKRGKARVDYMERHSIEGKFKALVLSDEGG